MRLWLAKTRFAHAWLWQRDETYRLAVVLGPPVLLGLGLALGGVHEWQRLRAGTAPAWLAKAWAALPFAGAPGTAPWARPLPGAGLPQDGTPTALAPTEAMPPNGPSTILARLRPGWLGEILTVQGQDEFDLSLGNVPLGKVSIPGPGLDMSTLIAAAPGPGRHALAASGAWMVRGAGHHALSVRVSRPAGRDVAPANCLSRVLVGGRLAISQVQIGVGAGQSLTYDPVVLDLQPGFYKIAMAFGCWHGDGTPAGSTGSLMLRRPGEAELSPMRGSELYYPREP